MDYEIVGKKVIHKSFGTGIICSFDGRYLDVVFSDAEKECRFQFPSCFYRFLTLEDGNMQKLVEPAVERWKEENEIEKKEELKQRQLITLQAIEERRKAAEQKKLRAVQRNSERRAFQDNHQKDKEKQDG